MNPFKGQFVLKDVVKGSRTLESFYTSPVYVDLKNTTGYTL